MVAHPFEKPTNAQQNLEVDYSEVPLPEVTRRRFLQLGLYMVTGAAYAVEGYHGASNMVMENHWPSGESVVSELHPELLPAYEGWFVLPGFGNTHGDHMAQKLDKLFGGSQSISYVHYANKGTSEKEVTHFMRKSASRLNSLNIYGHSMGGTTAMLAARKLGKPLNHIVLNCSPFDIHDAKDDSEVTQAIAWFGEMTGFKGDPLVKYSGTYLTQLRRKGWGHLLPETISAAKETWQGASPELLVSQLKLLDSIDLMKHQDEYHGVITPETRVVFCAPEYFSHDKTVNDAQAYEKWQEFFAIFGVKVDLLLIENAGHADSNRTIPQLSRWYNFPDVESTIKAAQAPNILTIQKPSSSQRTGSS